MIRRLFRRRRRERDVALLLGGTRLGAVAVVVVAVWLRRAAESGPLPAG